VRGVGLQVGDLLQLLEQALALRDQRVAHRLRRAKGRRGGVSARWAAQRRPTTTSTRMRIIISSISSSSGGIISSRSSPFGPAPAGRLGL
jgi:hypothetical protein